MPTRRISDQEKPWFSEEVCRDREHNIPSHMYFPSGEYEHTCPTCGNVIRFTVARPTL